MYEEAEGERTPAKTDQRVVQVVAMCLLSAFLSGGAAWVASQSSNGQAVAAAVAANTVQIATLQTRMEKVVSTDSFGQYQRAQEAQEKQTHDFQLRIDAKIDTLLSEHSRRGNL